MSSTVAGPAEMKEREGNVHQKVRISHRLSVLHREKNSVFPASALALSTALLTAKRTEELKASGGSPTAVRNKQKDHQTL